MNEVAAELNFDGIVGPSHNYAGLAYGNVASATYKNTVSNPRAAALEGLEKMRRVAALGVPQAVLPPLRRPRLELLRACGFCGEPGQLIAGAAESAPELLAASYSASNMWTANAATVSPSADCVDGRLHLTVANLVSTLHRAVEADSTYRMLKFLLASGEHFEVHPPLGPGLALSDEGAANHTRLCAAAGEPGIELFTFGRAALRSEGPAPQKFPARQTLEACQAIARRHGLRPENTIYLQQDPAAIDAGVFHNDVIAVGNRDLLLLHQRAYLDQPAALESLRKKFAATCGKPLQVIQINESELGLTEAVRSYLFNSQLLTLPNGEMALVCPQECRQLPAAERCLKRILAESNPISHVIPVDLRQSMQNGGGPACLRLRAVLTAAQQAALHPGIMYSPELHTRLAAWVERHYRDRLSPRDLADPALPREIEDALVELADLLQIPIEIVLDR